MLQRLQALVWPQTWFAGLRTLLFPEDTMQCPAVIGDFQNVCLLIALLSLSPAAKHFLLPAKHAQATFSSSSSPNPPWQFYTGLPFFPRLIADSGKRFFYFGIWTPTIEIAISQDAPKYECVRVSTRLASPQIRKIPSFATSC